MYIPRRYLIVKRLRGFSGNDNGAPFYYVLLAFVYICVTIICMTVCVSVCRYTYTNYINYSPVSTATNMQRCPVIPCEYNKNKNPKNIYTYIILPVYNKGERTPRTP